MSKEVVTSQQFLQEFVAWAGYVEKGCDDAVRYYMCSNQEPNTRISYAQGKPDLDPESGVFRCEEAPQYFNDRTWAEPASGTVCPLDPKQTDKFRLEIDTRAGKATITLLSQGNYKATFDLRYENRLLYGFDHSTMYVISLHKRDRSGNDRGMSVL